ncbi:type II toxin-antitoxin system VapB family antitoxin [Glycomyces sp. TRM65418]|uniref:type II toxin-antitoxin system VapB family antitoxin n=1 Tax=Glycomyces sp. TRM65418 TaxID=2867006 RepID=UPI001CE62D30|nr:type II toxin-antitoxin system VapB family antitoxin [Glycomyces sp. TRM65418]MCC3764851.1 type II toxin-antitoxin system VapB family antitoxin [Glycomyces sp. TRM65418]QZD54498.1 type II toxin-antitoxin system VapB family antitoxin [Glycomyces sp. TRM65418]
MALSIKSPAADQLARELVAATGESLTEAVEKAIRERLERQAHGLRSRRIRHRLDALRAEARSLPVLDSRASDDIIGYDEDGLPT